METIKNLAAFASYIITFCTLVGLLCKPVREYFVKKITHDTQTKEILDAIADLRNDIKALRAQVDSDSEKQKALEEAEKCSLRNTITHLYYKYQKQGSIPALEKENFALLCKAYFGLNGNSYVKDTCYDETMSLPVC